MLILNPATVSSYLPYRNGLCRKYCCQKIMFFFVDSAIDFKDAGGPPMLIGPLPDPKTSPNPQKSIFPPGRGGAPLSNAYQPVLE